MRRQGGDASFLIGIVLGLVIGAAVAIILAEATQSDGFSLDDGIKKAQDSLESVSDRARIAGASDGAAPK